MSFPTIDDLTEDYGNVRIEIQYDQDPLNPLTDWDSLTTIRGWHRRMTIGHGPDLDPSSFEDWDDMIQNILLGDESPIALLAPLYWYEHSGVTCKMGAPIPLTGKNKQPNDNDLADFRARCLDSQGWDSGVAGLVYVTAKNQAECGTPDESLEDAARQEVATYAEYLEGMVYAYVVSEITTCDHGDEHSDVLDSLCGMYGGTDYALSEARSFVGASVIPWLRIG